MSCLYCGSDKDLVRDHLVPRSRGGTNIPENIVQACRSCNSRKLDRLPSEWRNDLDAAIYDLERRVVHLHSKIAPRKKDAKEQKEKIINVRCTEQQKERLETIAANEGLGVSTWILRAALILADTRAQQR